MKGIFVTGTDTGVGKTQLACALADKYTKAGLRVAVRKPVESGCEISTNTLFPKDAHMLCQAAGEREPLEVICPYRFEAAISPESAALQTNAQLTLDDVKTACAVDAKAHDMLIVEGAGGWLSPMAENTTNADLAVSLGLPIVLVVADRLGCVNHTLLTLESMKSRGCKVQNIYLMGTCEDQKISYVNDLKRWVGLPIVCLPFTVEKKPWKTLLKS